MARTYKHLLGVAAALLGALLIVPTGLRAQEPIMETKPRPPILKGLDINPLTGAVTITWSGVAPDPRVPNATGYIIYRRTVNAAGQANFDPVGEVDASTFTFTDLNGGAHMASASYRIAAKGPTDPSEMTPPHSTIFVELLYDTCHDQITMKWSPYVGWGNRIEQYVLYSGESASWEGFQPSKDFRSTQTSYTTKVPMNKRFFYYIKAQSKIDETMWTSSNLVEVRTRSQRKPNRLTLDSIISMPASNRITFSISETTPLRYYLLTRTLTERYRIRPVVVDTIRDPRTTFSEDTIGGQGIQSGRKFYRLAGIDECGREVDSSRVSNSITIRVTNRNNVVNITWDSLVVQGQNNAIYKIYRTVMAKDSLDNKTEEIATFDRWSRVYEYSDDVSRFQGKGKTGLYCYHVKAWESAKMKRLRTSESSRQCTRITPEVLLPTAIAPLERGQVSAYTELTRNVFQPLATYESTFRLTVYNRDGAVVYNGYNRGWNGILPNGSYAPEGAYIYRLEVYSDDHSPQVLNGSFMVVYPETKR